jgi:hypothetical protein
LNVHRPVAGHHHNRHTGAILPHPTAQLDAVHLAELDVTDDSIERSLAQRRNGIFCRGTASNLEAVVAQAMTQLRQKIDIVFDD